MQTQSLFGNASAAEELRVAAVKAARELLRCGYTDKEIAAMTDEVAVATCARIGAAHVQAREDAGKLPDVNDARWYVHVRGA